MKTPYRTFTLFLVFVLALIPLQTALAASDATSLSPISLTDTNGTHSGVVSALNLRNQNWSDDNPANYVQFNTPGVRYDGYRTYQTPGGISARRNSSRRPGRSKRSFAPCPG